MKKLVTVAMIAGGALALVACQGEAPAEEAPAETEMMAPAEEPVADEAMTDEAMTDEAAAEAAAEGVDGTNNPISPAAE